MFGGIKVYHTSDIYVGKITTIDPVTRTNVYVKSCAFKRTREKNGILDSTKNVDTYVPLEDLGIYYYCTELEPLIDYLPDSEISPYISANRVQDIMSDINNHKRSARVKVLKDETSYDRKRSARVKVLKDETSYDRAA